MKTEIFNLIFLVLTIVVLNNHQTYSANILAFITDHSRSHCIIQETLLKALAKRSHNVSNKRSENVLLQKLFVFVIVATFLSTLYFFNIISFFG